MNARRDARRFWKWRVVIANLGRATRRDGPGVGNRGAAV